MIDSQQLAQNVAVKQSTNYLDDPDLRFNRTCKWERVISTEPRFDDGPQYKFKSNFETEILLCLEE